MLGVLYDTLEPWEKSLKLVKSLGVFLFFFFFNILANVRIENWKPEHQDVDPGHLPNFPYDHRHMSPCFFIH